jgi:hypothetical protein
MERSPVPAREPVTPVIVSMAIDQRRRLESALSELIEAKDLLERAL